MLLTAALLMSTQTSAAPHRLLVEGLSSPLGIATREPRFSWWLSDIRDGAKQTAYRIQVSSTRTFDAPDFWDSEKVPSENSIWIAYKGKRLQSGERYFWRVMAWDQDHKPSPWSETAEFGVGLLVDSDWSAKWIGDATPAPPYGHAHNGFHSQMTADPNETKWVAIDLGEILVIDGVRLWPARPYDWIRDEPGFLFPIRYRIEAANREDFSGASVVFDHTLSDIENPRTEAKEHRFTPVEARFVRLVVTRLAQRQPAEFGFALAELEALSGNANVSENADVFASDFIHQGGWSKENLTDGDTKSHPVFGYDALPAPMFRKEFSVQDVARATLHITALGFYEATINEKLAHPVGLYPDWTDYHKRVLVQTCDVTQLVRDGINVIGVTLGDGWYAGRIGMAASLVPGGPPRGVYGRLPLLRLQLEIEHKNGSRSRVVSDESWRSTIEGPIRKSDLLDGELYDARREFAGWNEIGFDDSAWQRVIARELSIICEPQPNEPIRKTLEIPAILVSESNQGVYVFDLGQNLAGWCRLRIREARGTEITLRHAEAINEDGTIYTANLRGAPQADKYIAAGKELETFEPKFTQHGFRYVEVTGLTHPPNKEDLVAIVVHSDGKIVSSLDCSDPSLNKLWQNILWTQRANLMSVPTDCPQRDERLGWMGDILSFGQTAFYNMQLGPFMRKWLQDVRDAQSQDGQFADFAPHPFGKDERFTGAPGWGDAGVGVAWTAFINTGDLSHLEMQFDAAKRWIEYVTSKNPDLIWRNERGNDYGDWLNGDTLIAEGWPRSGSEVPKEIFATMMFAESARIVERMAKLLNKPASDLYERIKVAFQSRFVDSKGRMPGDTQAGYALALYYDLIPRELREKSFQLLVNAIERVGFKLSTGFHSTLPAMMVLTQFGRADLAYKLILNREFPGWLYSVDNGATTIWERWDGFVKGRGFQDPGMNSLNHWAFGAVGEWMMKTIIGITPDENAPGYKHFFVTTQSGGNLEWAKGSLDTAYGRIELEWHTRVSHIEIQITVPPNTSATIRATGQVLAPGKHRVAIPIR